MISISLIHVGDSLLRSARDRVEEAQQKMDEYLQVAHSKIFKTFRKEILNEFSGFQIQLDRLHKQERKDDAWLLNVEDEEAYIRGRCSELQDRVVSRALSLLRDRFCSERGASNERAMSQIEKLKEGVERGCVEWERRQRVFERINEEIKKAMIHVVSLSELYRMLLDAMPCLDLQERVQVRLVGVEKLRGSIRAFARQMDQIISNGNGVYLKIDPYRKEGLIRDDCGLTGLFTQINKALNIRSKLRKMWDCVCEASCACRAIRMQLSRVIVRAKEETRELAYFLSLKQMCRDPFRLFFCYSPLTQIGISIRFFLGSFSARVMAPKWDRFLALREEFFYSPCLSSKEMTAWLGQMKDRFSSNENLSLPALHLLYRKEGGISRLLLLPCMRVEREPFFEGSLPFEPSLKTEIL